jgi:hypothetical protein
LQRGDASSVGHSCSGHGLHHRIPWF